jgi:hypothetical protein
MSHVDEGTLHAYLDGELPSSERAALEAHLAECAACRTRLTEERALVARSAQLLGMAQPQERPAPPLDALRRPKRRFWEVRMPVAWAASIALALSVGYYLRDSVPAPMAAAPEPASGLLGSSDERRGYNGQPPLVSTPSQQRAAPRSDTSRREDTPLPIPTDAVREEATNVAKAPEQPARDTPTASPRAELQRRNEVVTRAPAAAVAPFVPEQPGNAEWPTLSIDRARQILGTAPVGVPGLAVRSVRREPVQNGAIVVEQELGGKTIQLFQTHVMREKDALGAEAAGAAAEGRRAARSSERLARLMGSLRVEIAGPLSSDSLNRLLEQVKPLP